MRYFFNGKIEKLEDIYCIRIPFNIWEVCQQRGFIHADITLNNKVIECELLPEEKGSYKIYLNEEDVSHVDITKVYKILLHISNSLIEIGKESPYTPEHPIRTINSMNILIQPDDGLCGQTCVAMLAGVTIAEVISDMGFREWQATIGRVIPALNYYGLGHTGTLIYPGGGKEVIFPKCCIIIERMGRFGHYLVHYDGKFYDPSLGIMEYYDTSKLLGYLEVTCA